MPYGTMTRSPYYGSGTKTLRLWWDLTHYSSEGGHGTKSYLPGDSTSRRGETCVNHKIKMIKRVILLLFLLLSFVGVFGAGIFTATMLHIGSPIVTIDFVNNSPKKIRLIEISRESTRDANIRYQIPGLDPGKARTFKMYALGESSYEVVVTFSGDTRLVGEEGYVEGGYKVKETIGPQKIESEVDLVGDYKS
jgi:hypothetical protein